MKAEIMKDGYIQITAENIPEAFALKSLYPLQETRCESCGQVKEKPVVINTNILNKEDNL